MTACARVHAGTDNAIIIVLSRCSDIRETPNLLRAGTVAIMIMARGGNTVLARPNDRRLTVDISRRLMLVRRYYIVPPTGIVTGYYNIENASRAF